MSALGALIVGRGLWFKCKVILLGSSLVLMAGCHIGGAITTVYSTPTPAPIVTVVSMPTIATPAVSPYYSQGNSVQVTGMCMNGNTVFLSGDVSDKQDCLNSSFSFSVSKKSDGVYPLLVTQQDSNQNVSKPVSFVWVRKTTLAPPVILVPTTLTYPSADAVLSISGNCESGDTVSLSGDGAGSTVCAGANFSLSLPKAIDGDYTVVVTQTDWLCYKRLWLISTTLGGRSFDKLFVPIV